MIQETELKYKPGSSQIYNMIKNENLAKYTKYIKNY